MCFTLRKFSSALLLAVFAASSARAVTLDWNALTWAPGSLSNSYDIDPAKAGNDVTVTVGGDTGQLTQIITSPYPASPAVTNAFHGGTGSGQGTLHLALDLNNSSRAISVTLDFSTLYAAGIYHLSFTLFDVDYANGSGSTYQDRISSIFGTTVGGTQVAPTITTSLNNSVTGSGLARVVNGTASTSDVGPTSGNANVTFSFGHTAIRSFTFTYGCSSAFGNPTYQHIGLYDFSYSPVPEINPAWSAVFSCAAAFGLILRHRANFPK